MGLLDGTHDDHEKTAVGLHFYWILNNLVSNMNTLDPLRSNYLAPTA
jgi:hypothetical protein